MRQQECKQCGKTFKIINPKTRNVKFCSALCRGRSYYEKRDGATYQRIMMDKRRQQDDKPKIQCQVCGKWFRQVGTHVVQVHGYIKARYYREDYGFDVKRGQLPEDYRKTKAEQVVENGTINNLVTGAPYRFKKGKVPNYIRSAQTMERLKQNKRIKTNQ